MNFVFSIIALFLASYLPRVLPLLLCRKKLKSRFIRSFLFYMPYAVLSALTFPAIFFSTGSIVTASIGTVVALILSFFNINLAFVACICVAIVFGLGSIL